MREIWAVLGMAAMTVVFALFYRHKACSGGGCGSCGNQSCENAGAKAGAAPADGTHETRGVA